MKVNKINKSKNIPKLNASDKLEDISNGLLHSTRKGGRETKEGFWSRRVKHLRTWFKLYNRRSILSTVSVLFRATKYDCHNDSQHTKRIGTIGRRSLKNLICFRYFQKKAVLENRFFYFLAFFTAITRNKIYF